MNFKIARNNKGFTQDYVASFLGIDRTTYSRYENGTIQPDTKTLLKLSELFECSVDYLLGNSNKGKKTPPDHTEDVSVTLNKTLESLIQRQDGLMFFDGEPIDDETKKLLEISLENTIRLAKEMIHNKKKTK